MGNNIAILIPTKFRKEEKNIVINSLKKKLEIEKVEDQLGLKLPRVIIHTSPGKYPELSPFMPLIYLEAFDVFENFTNTETVSLEFKWWHGASSKYNEVIDTAIGLCALLGANTFYGFDEGGDAVLFIGSKKGKEEYLEAIEKQLKHLEAYREATKEEIKQLIKETGIFEKRKNDFVLIKFREDPWNSQIPLQFYRKLKKEENKT